MYIRSPQLANFRNYESLSLEFSEGTNILYGDNAQGKTNILEALYLVATTKSHRSVRDRDMIRFGCQEGHIRTVLIKNGVDYQVDMHLRAAKTKGLAINGQKLKRASQLMGLLHIVFFSPEDLTIVKNGPAYRRHFLDMELCQLDGDYLFNLNHYNRIVDQRNRLLKEIWNNPDLEATLDVWDDQLADYGTKIIARRREFMEQLADLIGDIHLRLSGGREHLSLQYLPDTEAAALKEKLLQNRERDKYLKSTSVGPHKDDFSFVCNEIDLRKFGSQGQQRTCALSLKLAEIELVKKMIGDSPVLMLDDVLSELDSNRQNALLKTIGGLQTIITCTGLDEFVSHRFAIDRLYRVENGVVTQSN